MPDTNSTLRQVPDEVRPEPERFEVVEAHGGARDDLHRLLVENMVDASHLISADGVIRFATPSMEALLGFSAAELVGRHAAELVHPEDVERTASAFEHDITHVGATRVIEARVRHQDGSWRMLEMMGKSVRDGAGKPVLLITSRDVTERRRAETLLRTREERYRRFFEDDLTGDFVATPGGQLLACNSAFASILGYDSVDEILAVRTQVLYRESSVRERFLERLRREKVLQHLVLELCRKDGQPVFVIENVVGTFDEAGELVEFRGYLFDITEQRRLADEHARLLEREREARAQAEAAERRTAFLAEVGNVLDESLDYRTTFRNLARLMVPTMADYCLIDEVADDGGSVRVAVAHVNPESERALLPEERNPPDADPRRHPVVGVLRTGEPVLVPRVSGKVLESIAHDAEHLAMLRRMRLRAFIIVPLVARGRTLGAMTLVSSISGRQYSQQDLEFASVVSRRAALAVDNARLYSRAQQAARAREEVLAFVSHDLRNPLATILLNASALMDQIPGERLTPDEREQLEWIARSSEQMNRLIEDLMEVARMEAGGMPLKRQPTSLDQLVTEVGFMHQPLALEKGLRLEWENGAEGMMVNVHRDRVARVMSNLVGNAIKFTPAGGLVRLSVAPYEQLVRVSVADTGTGIPEEDRPFIFDRYWQGGHGGRGLQTGNGLGLTIARGIVEAHGGKIWFESTIGEGTTFHFTLPVTAG